MFEISVQHYMTSYVRLRVGEGSLSGLGFETHSLCMSEIAFDFPKRQLSSNIVLEKVGCYLCEFTWVTQFTGLGSTSKLSPLGSSGSRELSLDTQCVYV